MVRAHASSPRCASRRVSVRLRILCWVLTLFCCGPRCWTRPDPSLSADQRAEQLSKLQEQVDALYLVFGISNNTETGEPLIDLVSRYHRALLAAHSCLHPALTCVRRAVGRGRVVGWWQVEGGADKMVTLDNIGEFVSLATRAMLHDTVAEQVCVASQAAAC